MKGRVGLGVSRSTQASQRSLRSFAHIRSIQNHSHEKNAWKLISAAHCSVSRKKKFPFFVMQKSHKIMKNVFQIFVQTFFLSNIGVRQLNAAI